MNTKQATWCGEIARHYGKTKQKVQAVQELSELICVLTRRKDQEDAAHQLKLIDEIADSLVMIEQIRQLYGISGEEIEHRIEYKLLRQLARIKAEGTEKEVHSEY